MFGTTLCWASRRSWPPCGPTDTPMALRTPCSSGPGVEGRRGASSLTRAFTFSIRPRLPSSRRDGIPMRVSIAWSPLSPEPDTPGPFAALPRSTGDSSLPPRTSSPVPCAWAGPSNFAAPSPPFPAEEGCEPLVSAGKFGTLPTSRAPGPASSARLAPTAATPNSTMLRRQETIRKPFSVGVRRHYSAGCDAPDSGAGVAPRSRNKVCSAGTTTSRMIGPMNMPPTTTVASGRWT